MPIALALVTNQFLIIFYTFSGRETPGKHSKTIIAPVSIDFVLFFFIFYSKVLPTASALVTNQFILIFYTFSERETPCKHSKTINAPVSIDFVLFFFIFTQKYCLLP